MTTSAPQELDRLVNLAPHYDAVFCDIWGVVHNGQEPHPTALEALISFRELGKYVVLVTNAPRANSGIARQLARMGIGKDVYDAIQSSGEVTRALIAPYADMVVHHITDGDAHLLDGLSVRNGPVDEAACVVVSELEGDMDRPEDYQERMEHWLRRGLTLICVNPDKIVEVAGQMIYCPGALADIYAQMGGKVIQAGKPHHPIYEAARTSLTILRGKEVPSNRILAIGDSVRTDATGAASQGLDFLFITGSLHADELDAFGSPDPQAVADLIAPSGANLVGFQARLA